MTTNTTSRDLQQRINDTAINGIQRLLDASGKLTEDGHLQMSITIKLVVKASEENTHGDRTSYVEAYVCLHVRADIDGSLSATADGNCHSER